jgi:hypothetical protein
MPWNLAETGTPQQSGMHPARVAMQPKRTDFLAGQGVSE